MNSLDKLPAFRDAIKLPLKEYKAYATSMYKERNWCSSSFVAAFEKLYEWCIAMNCVEDSAKCKIPLHPLEMITTVPTTTSLPTTTTSYLQMVHSVGNNGTCYDDFFCQPEFVTFYLHMVLGYSGLIMCLFGILMTVLFIPVLNIPQNRTGATLYLTAMAVYDSLYIVFFTTIVVIRYLPSTYIEQLDMYARYTTYLIPQGLPTMQMMELFSVWLTVAILVDRFLYLKLGFHSKLVNSRKLSINVIVVVTVVLILYTVPKYLQYKLVDYPRIGMKKVMLTEVGENDSFKNLLMHWLKVPVEMFLPYLGVTIFSVINSIKFHDLMVKRKFTENAKNRNCANQQPDILSDDEIGIASNHQNMDLENNTVSQTYYCCIPTSTQFLLSSSLKSQADRENLNVLVTLIIGFSMLALKIPKFVLHALKSEEYVASTSTKYFQPVSDYLDLIWVISRPILYLAVAAHFRQALRMTYCFCYRKQYKTEIISAESNNVVQLNSFDLTAAKSVNKDKYYKNNKSTPIRKISECTETYSNPEITKPVITVNGDVENNDDGHAAKENQCLLNVEKATIINVTDDNK